MKYTVVWLKAAQDHLANIWITAADKAAVTAASNAIDLMLAQDPHANSQARGENERIMWLRPLGVGYTVSDPDCMVTVWAVWRIDPLLDGSNGQNKTESAS